MEGKGRPTLHVALALAACCLLLSPAATASQDSLRVRKKVIVDIDGGVDDFVTLLLLLSKPAEVEVIAVTILDADCIANIAANTTVKLLKTVGAGHIPVAVSTLPAVNPFPYIWRWSPLSVDVLPMINKVQVSAGDVLAQVPGQDFLADLIMSQEQPVTIVATGPLSNVAYVLDKHGEAAAAKISEVWWMGGAVEVAGNVEQPGKHDGSAEWNAYWDPPALGVVWGSSVPLVMVPLDATNHVPITLDFLYRFGEHADSLYAVIAGSMWAKVTNWIYETPNVPYYAWDTLTAACFLNPAMCERKDGVETQAMVSGMSAGRTALKKDCSLAPEAEASKPKEVSVITHVDAEAFYSFVLATFGASGPKVQYTGK